MTLGKCPFGKNQLLRPDAQNLAEVLNILQSRRYRFEIFNKKLNYVFPNVREITVEPEGSNQVQIKIWNTGAPLDRDDLAQLLSESGTGIGQVLAILYVIITSETPQIIIIDEPNTFLHPGAVRRLFDVMRSLPIKHQYIFATHSTEVIAASEAKTIHLIQWKDERSEIHPLVISDTQNLRHALSEVGARLSDVFGADSVIWVEGPTEAECFPLIAAHFDRPVSFNTTLVPLPSTGEIERKRQNLERVLEIYERVGSSNALLPQHLTVSLDREKLTDREMADLRKRSRNLIQFIPRRTFENYLLLPDAIAAVLNMLPTFEKAPTDAAAIQSWLKEAGKKSKYSGNSGSLPTTDPRWVIEVNAPKLLSDLFSELSENREGFDKMTHCPMLTKWILENDKEQFRELADYISSLASVEGYVPREDILH